MPFNLLFREGRKGLALSSAGNGNLLVIVGYGSCFSPKIIFRVRRITLSFSVEKTCNLSFVFLKQTVRIIFGMSLEVYDTELVMADGHVSVSLNTFH